VGENLGTEVERLVGGSAADTLGGGAKLEGGAGSDALTAGAGGTVLLGGEGDDTLTGGAAADEFGGAAGADRIFARDGVAEVVACGEGVDVVDFDLVDQLTADCELPPTDPLSGGGPGAGDPGGGLGSRPGVLPPAPHILLGANPLTVTSTPGVVSVKLGCAADAPEDCSGEVILELTQRVSRSRGRALAARGRYVARQQRVGRRRYRVRPGKRIGVRVRLNARGHAILRSRRRARGRIRVRQRDTAGRLLGETTRPVSFTARKWGRRPPRRGSRSR
jgi:hypothetical protein